MRRIITITGDGKGKTTSSIGAVVRALGRGLKPVIYQFIKSKEALYGEHLFFRDNNLCDVVPLGFGCRKDFKYNEDDIRSAKEGFKRIKNDLKNLKYEFVVLDEITYPVNWSWIPVNDVLDLINSNKEKSFVLTGRDMPNEFIDISDTSSEVKEIKHAYQKGVNAQIGYEY